MEANGGSEARIEVRSQGCRAGGSPTESKAFLLHMEADREDLGIPGLLACYEKIVLL